MKCIKVLSFFLIFLFTFASCSNSSDDIEVGGFLVVRAREISENYPVDSDDFLMAPSMPVISLKQYLYSLKVNILIFLIHEFYLEPEIRIGLFFYLILNVLIYFNPILVNPNPNNTNRTVRTVTIHEWLLAPLSWFTEVLILLPHEKPFYLSDVNTFTFSNESLLFFVFILQMIFYISAFYR